MTATLFLAIAASLSVGGVSLSLSEFQQVIMAKADARLSTIVLEIRLPRSLLAVLVGAGVSAAGAAIQGLFRNPLADPALIGVSAGAALFAALFIVIGGSQGIAVLGMTGSAFLGGLIATWVVLLVGQRGGGLSTMLLAGIAINAIALSGVGLLSYLSSDLQLRSISVWALGSLNGANWMAVATALAIPILIGLLYLESLSLNVVTLGDEEAAHLGVSHEKLRVRIILLSALAVGIGVALTGVIAFLGLVVPHLIRMTLGSNHKIVLPGSALLGGLLLLVADTLARTVFAPAELPVGILTALVGGPFFVFLILREQKGRLAL
ncbi:uncharacterized protein METZ01_LOCUS176901 [marine metagenome]|uniref:ABC transporter permease protein n=1 Tax=marine metagenome TaxID=408172 RepID=A0A382CFG0_9ZZZZ